MKGLFMGLLTVFQVTGAGAQPLAPLPEVTDSASVAFIEAARAASRPFQQLDAAIAAGYRKVGPDMPNMGEHWINIRRVMRRRVDPAEPAVLTYLRIGGQPVLTGVAYTVPVLAGEPEPPAPIPGGTWHYHAGTIDDELIGHEPGAMQEASEGVRLAMLHAWVWSGNPAGVFTADNWGLPFLRLGLPVPAKVPPRAAKTLFLLDGGADYYLYLIRAVCTLPPEKYRELQAVFERHRAAVAALPRDALAHEATLAQLVSRWDTLWTQIREHVGADTWARLHILAH